MARLTLMNEEREGKSEEREGKSRMVIKLMDGKQIHTYNVRKTNQKSSMTFRVLVVH